MKQRLLQSLDQVRRELGRLGIAALVLIAGAYAATFVFLEPAQEKRAELAAALQAKSAGAPAARPPASGEKIASLYAFLAREEAPTDWLARLYGIGKGTGIELASASYKLHPAPAAAGAGASRIERYEIVLPVTGTYAQLREFIGRSLAEIPVLSLDQVSLKRESRNEREVSAELRMTLHMVKK